MNAFRTAIVGLTLALAACSNGREPGFQGWVEADLIFVSPDENGRVQTLAVRGVAVAADLLQLGHEKDRRKHPEQHRWRDKRRAF